MGVINREATGTKRLWPTSRY